MGIILGIPNNSTKEIRNGIKRWAKFFLLLGAFLVLAHPFLVHSIDPKVVDGWIPNAYEV
jgi:hypothetical protein